MVRENSVFADPLPKKLKVENVSEYPRTKTAPNRSSHFQHVDGILEPIPKTIPAAPRNVISLADFSYRLRTNQRGFSDGLAIGKMGKPRGKGVPTARLGDF